MIYRQPPPRSHNGDRIGVLTNLNAGRIRREPRSILELHPLVAEHGLLRNCAHSEEASAAIEDLLAEEVSIIGVNGGDGTFGPVLRALFSRLPRGPRPALLPMRGGTMNMVGNELGWHGGPSLILRRVVEMLREGRLVRQPLKTLEVSDSQHEESFYGFVWANGMPFEFLREYYATGEPSVGHALRTVTTLIAGAPLPRERYRRAWRPVPARVTVDGQTQASEKLRAAVASTLRKLVLWFAPFAEGVGKDPDEFGFGLNRMSMPKALLYLPLLSRGYVGRNPEEHLSRVARRVEIETDAGYVLDGELVEPSGATRITIRTGPAIDVVLPRAPTIH